MYVYIYITAPASSRTTRVLRGNFHKFHDERCRYNSRTYSSSGRPIYRYIYIYIYILSIIVLHTHTHKFFRLGYSTDRLGIFHGSSRDIPRIVSGYSTDRLGIFHGLSRLTSENVPGTFLHCLNDAQYLHGTVLQKP